MPNARIQHLDWLNPYLLDQEVIKQRLHNYALSAEKTKRRAQYGGEPRGDFFDRVLIKSAEDNKDGEGMSLDEMVNNTSVLILGGAETSATTLSGTTYLLLKNPSVMGRLQQEIRSTFKSSDEIGKSEALLLDRSCQFTHHPQTSSPSTASPTCSRSSTKQCASIHPFQTQHSESYHEEEA